MIHGWLLNFHDQIVYYHKPFQNKVKNQRKDNNGLINGSVTFKLYLSNIKFFSHKYANDIFCEYFEH